MKQEKRWEQRLEDFQKAYSRLESALSNTELEELEKDGVVQRFEFTFELAWKTLKDYAEEQGFADVASPKKAIQKAFEIGLFEDGDLWMEMLVDRNTMSHLYDEKASGVIFENIKNKYLKALGGLADKLKKE
jgi:nucleotidyltransferase substrate binding protein (TIGR01987 family)